MLSAKPCRKSSCTIASSTVGAPVVARSPRTCVILRNSLLEGRSPSFSEARIIFSRVQMQLCVAGEQTLTGRRVLWQGD